MAEENVQEKKMSVEISRKGFLAGMSAAAWSMLYGSPADAGEKRLRLGVMGVMG